MFRGLGFWNVERLGLLPEKWALLGWCLCIISYSLDLQVWDLELEDFEEKRLKPYTLNPTP